LPLRDGETARVRHRLQIMRLAEGQAPGAKDQKTRKRQHDLENPRYPRGVSHPLRLNYYQLRPGVSLPSARLLFPASW
jgi:hypothetical protein